MKTLTKVRTSIPQLQQYDDHNLNELRNYILNKSITNLKKLLESSIQTDLQFFPQAAFTMVDGTAGTADQENYQFYGDNITAKNNAISKLRVLSDNKWKGVWHMRFSNNWCNGLLKSSLILMQCAIKQDRDLDTLLGINGYSHRYECDQSLIEDLLYQLELEYN